MSCIEQGLGGRGRQRQGGSVAKACRCLKQKGLLSDLTLHFTSRGGTHESARQLTRGFARTAGKAATCMRFAANGRPWGRHAKLAQHAISSL